MNEPAPAAWNTPRFVRDDAGGHYESWFLRANHPTQPQAFWIRYTIYSPRGRPADAIGELWAIAFDGAGRHVAVKSEHPIAACEFAREGLGVSIADARLSDGALAGSAQSGGHTIAWDLRYEPKLAPVRLLPVAKYTASIPRAKTVVPVPVTAFSGTLTVDGATRTLERWHGSQNHNWGSRHTDEYAWGQVAGFDGHADSFLELATARLRFGPLWTPRFTPLVLRHGGAAHELIGLGKSLRQGRGAVDSGGGRHRWSFRAQAGEATIEGFMEAKHADFVELRYYNPPGGDKRCLNCKIARCELTLSVPGQGEQKLVSATGGAFELLADW